MARFLDSHPMPGPVVPAQVVQGQTMQAARADIQAARADRFGVRSLNAFVARDRIYYLSEAPSVDALCQSHEAKGIRLGPGDVVEVLPLV